MNEKIVIEENGDSSIGVLEEAYYFLFNEKPFEVKEGFIIQNELDLYERLVKENKSATTFSIIINFLASRPEITALHLGGNELNDENIKTLIGVLKSEKGLKITNLKKLNLCDNEISDKGAQMLASGLFYTKNIENLDLSNNNIGMDGKDAFNTNKKLKVNLFNNENITTNEAVLQSDQKEELEILPKNEILVLEERIEKSDGKDALINELQSKLKLRKNRTNDKSAVGGIPQLDKKIKFSDEKFKYILTLEALEQAHNKSIVGLKENGWSYSDLVEGDMSFAGDIDRKSTVNGAPLKSSEVSEFSKKFPLIEKYKTLHNQLSMGLFKNTITQNVSKGSFCVVGENYSTNIEITKTSAFCITDNNLLVLLYIGTKKPKNYMYSIPGHIQTIFEMREGKLKLKEIKTSNSLLMTLILSDLDVFNEDYLEETLENAKQEESVEFLFEWYKEQAKFFCSEKFLKQFSDCFNVKDFRAKFLDEVYLFFMEKYKGDKNKLKGFEVEIKEFKEFMIEIKEFLENEKKAESQESLGVSVSDSRPPKTHKSGRPLPMPKPALPTSKPPENNGPQVLLSSNTTNNNSIQFSTSPISIQEITTQELGQRQEKPAQKIHQESPAILLQKQNIFNEINITNGTNGKKEKEAPIKQTRLLPTTPTPIQTSTQTLEQEKKEEERPENNFGKK